MTSALDPLRLRFWPVLMLALACLLVCFGMPATGTAQTRVSDRDVLAMMRNLNQDSKSFRQRFDAGVQKSAIRRTSKEKDARKLVEAFDGQTDELLKRFKKDRNGADRFRAVLNTATQVDALVQSVDLGARAVDQWQRVRLDLHQLAIAYNVPESFPVAAAAMPGGDTPREGAQWLRISAFADTPLAGADVAVYDSKGKKIFEKKNGTNDRGVYPARMSHIPRDFRVTITSSGARLRNIDYQSMGAFTLCAEVRNFDPSYGIVYVNPVTTLVCKVADKLPKHDLQLAESRVRQLLLMPENYDLGAAVRQGPYYRSPYFSETIFMGQARQGDGLSAFMDGLARQAATGRVKPEPFYDSRVNPAVAAAGFIVKGLIGGAFSWTAGQGIGWALSSGNKPEPGATKKDIEQLQEKLAGLQSSVNALQSQLTDLGDELKAELTQLNYTTYVVPALQLSIQVDHVEGQLSYYAQDCPPIPDDASSLSAPSQFCVDERSKIADQLNYVPVASSFETFAAFMLPNGKGGSLGMVRLYSQALGQKVRFFRPADSTKMQDMFDFWYAVEAQSANLRVEDMHFRNYQINSPSRIRDFLGDASADPPRAGKMQDTLAAEQKIMFPPVPPHTVINTKDRSMWLIFKMAEPDRDGYIVCSSPNVTLFQKGVLNYASAAAGIEADGFKWGLPSSSEAESLIQGWAGKSVNEWLIKKTQALPPEAPASPGFPDMLAPVKYKCGPDIDPRIFWASEGNHNNPQYARFSLINGKMTTVRALTRAWALLMRRLSPGEQYYWYPNQ